MKKSTSTKILTSLFIVVSTSLFSQKDKWDSIYNNTPTVTNFQHFQQNGVLTFNNKLIVWGDTTNSMYPYAGIKSFDPTTNSMAIMSFSNQINDGGLSSAVVYANTDIYFGMKNSTQISDYPNVYHYNAGTSSISSLTLNVANPNEYTGVSNLVMYSANSSLHDTLIAFAYNATNTYVEIFKQKIGDAAFASTSHTLALAGVDIAIVYKDTLFISKYDGTSSYLLWSVDGVNYTTIAVPTGNLPGLATKITAMDTLNGNLYVASHQEGSDFYNIGFANNPTSLISSGLLTSVISGNKGTVISFKKHKRELWFNATLGMLGRTALREGNNNNSIQTFFNSYPLVYRITSTNAIILSQDTVGLLTTDVPQSYQLVSANNELIMAGTYANGVSFPYFGSKYYKLVSPVAGFTNTLTTACLNSAQSFTSSCLGTDSVRWVLDGNYNYLANASASSTINLNFTTSGTHTLGIIAIGGTQTDTFKINILVVNPTITASPTSSIVCGASPTSLSATGPAGATYVWQPGTLSGAAQTVTITGNTIYTVTGTTSGCTNVQTVNLIYKTNPIITLSPSSSSICVGSSVTINATGAITSYSWSNGGVTPSISVSPSTTTNYTVTGIDINGCADTKTASVLVNTIPVVSISSSSSSICAGASATLTAIGATTYTWNNGSTINPLVDAPLINTSYTVTGANVAGCSNTATTSLIVNTLKTISGSVTVAGAPVAGDVTLYAYLPMYTKFDSITSIAISGTGAYTFTAPIADGQYIVKATPSANTLQITYGYSDVNWKTADIFTHGCIVPTATANINVIALTPLATGGLGSMSGQITQGPGYGQRTNGLKPLSTPIKGIIVKGGKNPGGSIVAQTTTDANGTYSLSGLPDDNYFILVDVPGLDTNNTYHKVITTGSLNYTGLDFTIDSTKINPINITTGINTLNLLENNIKVFPNPATNYVTINFTITQSSSVKIELFDVIGKSVKTIIDLENQQANSYQTTAPIETLSAGVYFLKIQLNKKEQVVKLFITQ